MVYVNELFRDRRRIGKQSQPAEGIDPLECLEDITGNGGAADAMIAVAAGDEVAVEAMLPAIFLVGYVRRVARDAAGRDVLRLVDDDAAHGVSCRIEILGDLGLAVDADAAAREIGEVDTVTLAAESNVEPFVP